MHLSFLILTAIASCDRLVCFQIWFGIIIVLVGFAKWLSGTDQHGLRSVELSKALENTYLEKSHERRALESDYDFVSSIIVKSIYSIYQKRQKMVLTLAMLLLMFEDAVEGITLAMRCALVAQLCPVCAQIMHRLHKLELDLK